MDALLPVLLGGLQVVPCVAETGQTKMRFDCGRLRQIACQVQDAPVGLGCQSKLGVCFLDVTQADGRPYVQDEIAGCLAQSDGFGIGPTGGCPVSLQEGGKPQRPERGSAGSQVAGVQILQGAARLGHDGVQLVGRNSQHGPDSGNLPDNVSGRIVPLLALHRGFGRLQFLFDAGKKARHR